MKYKLDISGRKHCNGKKPKNVRKFTSAGKKEFAFCTCGGSENTPSSKTNRNHTKIWWPPPVQFGQKKWNTPWVNVGQEVFN